MKIKALLLFPCLMLLLVCSCYGEEMQPMPAFNKADRVLFLAPHPDDEVIATGGILQQVISEGLPLKVVYFTNGDNNQLAFIVYEKRIVFRKGEFTFMGEVRRKEAVKAMGLLGIKEKDLIFLGYPDFGTMNIFTKYWGDDVPFKSMLTRVTNVPYKECFSYRAPYTGESVLIDLKTILEDFRPTKIFVSHPVDSNVDHRALYLFLQVALWDLEGHIDRPHVYPYLVHSTAWPLPRGYHPKLELLPPKTLFGADINWLKFDLTNERIEKKKSMISCYRSQIQYNPPYLYSFARTNEFFGDFPTITLSKHVGPTDWSGLEEKVEGASVTDVTPEETIETMAYKIQDGVLYIKVKLNKKLSINMGMGVYLFGYNKDISFSKMPKIRIRIGFKGNAVVYNKREQISLNDVKVDSNGKELTIQCSLSDLGNPDYILSCVTASNKGLPRYITAWRKIKLK